MNGPEQIPSLVALRPWYIHVHSTHPTRIVSLLRVSVVGGSSYGVCPGHLASCAHLTNTADAEVPHELQQVGEIHGSLWASLCLSICVLVLQTTVITSNAVQGVTAG
jgi:hypothetical protein